MELHERLVAARRHAGFENATKAADALGVAYPTYAGHENGSSGFRRDTAALYARRFGVSLDWLISGRGKMLDLPSDRRESEYLELFRSAHEDVQKSVLSILKHSQKT